MEGPAFFGLRDFLVSISVRRAAVDAVGLSVNLVISALPPIISWIVTDPPKKCAVQEPRLNVLAPGGRGGVGVEICILL